MAADDAKGNEWADQENSIYQSLQKRRADARKAESDYHSKFDDEELENLRTENERLREVVNLLATFGECDFCDTAQERYWDLSSKIGWLCQKWGVETVRDFAQQEIVHIPTLQRLAKHALDNAKERD